MSYHWRSSDARELFEKTVLRRVSLVVLIVLSLSPVSNGRLEIDRNCLHGQYHSLFADSTCVKVRNVEIVMLPKCYGKLTPDNIHSIVHAYTMHAYIEFVKIGISG